MTTEASTPVYTKESILSLNRTVTNQFLSALGLPTGLHNRTRIYEELLNRGMIKNPDMYSEESILGMSDKFIPAFLSGLKLLPGPNARERIYNVLLQRGQIAKEYFPFTKLPYELQSIIAGRVSPTARELTTVSKDMKMLADAAFAQNIRDDDLVDPTIGIPNREEYFKVDDIGRGLYSSPSPGLINNLKEYNPEKYIPLIESPYEGISSTNLGLIYGTIDVSSIHDKESQFVVNLIKNSSDGLIKFVSLVKIDDFENWIRSAENLISKLEIAAADLSLSTEDRQEAVDELVHVKETLLEDMNIHVDLRVNSVLPQYIKQYIASKYNKNIINAYSSFKPRLLESTDNRDILRKWGLGLISSIDPIHEINAYIVPSRNSRLKWGDIKVSNVVRVNLKKNNIRMIVINRDDLAHHRVILPSLQDDVYVL